MTIQDAFKIDGFNIVKTCPTGNYTGYAAESITAVNHLDGKRKRAYYLEGSSYDMGFQMGMLAHGEVEKMVLEFPYTAISGFLGASLQPWEKDLIVLILYEILIHKIDSFLKDIPGEYVDEANGIVDGVHKANPLALFVTFKSVWVLNVGFDVLVALTNNPLKLIDEIAKHPQAQLKKFVPSEKHFRIPHFCNAYSAYNQDKHFFGRDWMFNGGNVLANCASLIITKPNDGRKPLVYAAAPGLVGAALAMNTDGIAMGVDMVSAANGNYDDPGFNSLLLVRDCIHRSDSAKYVVLNAINAQRGATFIYPVSDGKNNTSCVIEAGMKVENLDPLSYVPKDMLSLLPDSNTLKTHAEQPVQGLFVRWQDYRQTMYFIDQYNEGLFTHFKKKMPSNVWGESGFVFNQPYNDPNAFGLYYFNPLRQNLGECNVENKNWIFQLVTNTWLNPYMNICSMSFFQNLLSEPFWSDMQWRYDLLNETLLSYQNNQGDTLDWDNAWKIINFLSPVIGQGEGQNYYLIPEAPWKLPTVSYKDAHGNTQSTWRVDGMTNLCECNEKKMRSLYGTYADEFVEITLPNYL